MLSAKPNSRKRIALLDGNATVSPRKTPIIPPPAAIADAVDQFFLSLNLAGGRDKPLPFAGGGSHP
jgi:hypothetical protein